MGIVRIPKKYFQPTHTEPDGRASGAGPTGKPKYGPMKKRYLLSLVERGRPLACEVCGWGLKRQWEGLLHVHHVAPKAMGGGDNSANLVLLCPNHHAVAHMFIRESNESNCEAVSGKRALVSLLRKFDELMGGQK